MVKRRVEKLENTRHQMQRKLKSRYYTVLHGNNMMKVFGTDIDFIGTVDEGKRKLESMDNDEALIIIFNVPPKTI